jgi:hypothetical protein
MRSPGDGGSGDGGRGFDERGQALLLALGGSLALIAVALALVAIAGAVTGKGRVQRAADLAAISAARSMRDDLPRLLSPPALPNGAPNPAHIERTTYLARARGAAFDVGRANGVSLSRLRVSFPDRASFAPVRVRAVVVAELDTGYAGGEGLDAGRLRRDGAAPATAGGTAAAAPASVEASAIAEAAAPAGDDDAAPATASGGGYGGPLVYRQGEGMRPDVAAAFDRMAASAARAGLALVVNSAFRSDAEQAALFAAHPDPRWVAPPGHSLHRCATELDLGPEDAYGWLATHAARFGFVQRYSWEPWHYGYATGPPPCSAAGNVVRGSAGLAGAAGGASRGGAGNGEAADGDGASAGAAGLPSFVPVRFRKPLLGAAARWNVAAALLSAQLMAESNFDPYAASPAGAEGIAQFIPSTAAAYGLRNPYDAAAAIDAQAHLMSDLLRRFGAPALALAAYNAGPAPVEACHCVPSIPETSAYVTRILALVGSTGSLAVASFEVRLVA